MATQTPTHVTPQLGLTSEATNRAVNLLSTLLADYYTLQLKLRKYHWNVTGPQFRDLHLLFEEQYDALAPVIDDTAERIRAYGYPAPGTLREFMEHTRLEENAGMIPTAHDMVLDLVKDHETLVRLLREDITLTQKSIEDVGLEDFLTGRLQEHQKMAWLLRSFIETPGLN